MMNLTPKRVEIRRISPVTQARVSLTNTTPASVAFAEASVSANHRTDDREVKVTSTKESDWEEAALPKSITPTI